MTPEQKFVLDGQPEVSVIFSIAIKPVVMPGTIGSHVLTDTVVAEITHNGHCQVHARGLHCNPEGEVKAKVGRIAKLTEDETQWLEVLAINLAKSYIGKGFRDDS